MADQQTTAKGDGMTDLIIAGQSLKSWQEFARRDDCLEYMVPSDLRQVIAALTALQAERDALKARAEAAEARLTEWASRAIAKAARVAELEAHDGTVMPRDVIRVSAMLIDALHVLDTEAVQIAEATNKSGGVDGVQVLEDAEKIIKAAAGLVASELMGVAALTPPVDLTLTEYERKVAQMKEDFPNGI